MALTIFFILTLFIWESHKGFSLWDEGFLWYGVQRVLYGEVPIRDFMAYDPGRYYWSAGIMLLWGDNGIIALRGTIAIFQALGLFCSLLLISRLSRKLSFLYLFLCGVIFLEWMFLRYKLFDISCSILLIWMLTFLIQHPTPRNYFFAGLYLGLIAIFGRNHGIYGLVGSICTIFWLRFKQREGPPLLKGFSLWTVGVFVGFSPLLFMALTIPGFAVAFWESIRFLFEIKTTNLPRPIPWPWRISFISMPFSEAMRSLVIGLFFIATLAFGTLSIAWITLKKSTNKQLMSAFAASAFLALPYAHYAYSRADIDHLALGIFPMLVGCLVLITAQPARTKWLLVLMLCAASLLATLGSHPAWQCRSDKQCTTVEISGSNLKVDRGTANDIALLRMLTTKFAGRGQSFIVAPFWPGAYPLLGQKSPMWEIYALFPRSAVFEQTEIERIKAAHLGFAFIFDFPLDGREELRFRNTHPLLQQYISTHFERIPDFSGLAYQIYKAKEISQ